MRTLVGLISVQRCSVYSAAPADWAGINLLWWAQMQDNKGFFFLGGGEFLFSLFLDTDKFYNYYTSLRAKNALYVGSYLKVKKKNRPSKFYYQNLMLLEFFIRIYFL